MDRLEAMGMLLAAVEHGSLSGAARQMGVAIPTLSRKVADLEAQLGAQLLTRTTRRLALTDAGAAYVVAARRILAEVDEAEREAAGEFRSPKGELVITASVLFGQLHVLPVVTEFLKAFPQIDIKLALGDRYSNLVDDHIDMAVRFGVLPDSDLVATRIGSMRSVVCGAPSVLAEFGIPGAPDELAGIPCVSTDGPMLSPAWQFRDPATGRAFERRIRPRLQVSTAMSAVAAAVDGVGLARVLLYQVADHIASGKLRLVLEPFETDPEPIHLVHMPRAQMPLKLRHFIDHAGPRLRASLASLDRDYPQPTS